MSDGRKYYCLCEANCKFETMTKEHILAAIAQAAETGLVFDAEAAFITKVKESNAGGFVTFWLGTQAQYNALVKRGEKDPNCFYVLTDCDSPAELTQKVKDLQNKLSTLTAADVGAAPAGYGLGENVRYISSANDITKTGWYYTDVGTPNSYWWHIMHTQQDVNSAIQLGMTFHASDRKIAKRTKANGEWSEWVNCSPDAFAPSGYGLGGYAKGLDSTNDLNTCLLGGWYAWGESTPQNAKYSWSMMEVVPFYSGEGCLQRAYCLISGFKNIVIQRYMSNWGEWTEWEWVNPLMIAGVEYRTTERYNGKAVYAKAVMFYTLPENSFKSVWVADGITALVRVEGYCQHTDGDMIQIECNSLISSVKIVGGTNLRIDSGVNASYWSCQPIVYYTK